MANCEGCNKSNVLKKLQAYAAPDGACSVNSSTISKYHIHWFCENGCASSFRKGIQSAHLITKLMSGPIRPSL